MIKSCVNCDEAFEGNRKQMFCSTKCEKEYGGKANVAKMPKKAISKPEFKEEEKRTVETTVIEFVPPKKPYKNWLTNVVVTEADKERLSNLYGKNDHRKNKCGF